MYNVKFVFDRVTLTTTEYATDTATALEEAEQTISDFFGREFVWAFIKRYADVEIEEV